MRIVLNKPENVNKTIIFDRENVEKDVEIIIDARLGGKYNVGVVMDHRVGGNIGNVIVKGVAGEGAELVINGLVKIQKGSHGVEDYLDMRVLLIDERSTAIVEPRLEIEADDVKASHAASVGKIDEEQLYYLMSRGINRYMAIDMIVNGFLGQSKRR